VVVRMSTDRPGQSDSRLHMARMRVGINCAIATRGISGSSRGLDHLLGALHEIADLDVMEAWPTGGFRRSRLWNAVTQASWDLHLAARSTPSAEVFISPCNIGRAARRQHHMLVLHDTTVLDHPNLYDPGYARYARTLFGRSVHSADVILVPSHYTQRCLVARWPDAPPVLVAPWPLEQRAPERYGSDASKQILMVGATEPNKQHTLGIAAVELARQRSQEHLCLTIIGPRGRAEREVAATLGAADPDKKWTARKINVSDTELEELYRSAWLLLQPSQIEGYGLPVGEAASRGIPVLHSGRGALNEIAPAAVASPDDPASYAAEICALLERGRYSRAVVASITAARQHTREHFIETVALALSSR
jgi:glycosyltransferase involved in cell wall biosynthesis